MSFKKGRKFVIFLASFFSGLPAIAFAGADSGFYIGAGVGDATVKDTDFEESDSAYKVFGCYGQKRCRRD